MNADIWERPELAHIRDFARSRRANPLSTLGVALVRATCQIPPHVVLPPTIGGRVAINLNVALVGPPGAGKGASEAAGRDCIQYLDPDFKPAPRPPEFSPGSGEGIARTLMEMDKDKRTALFIASEIDSLAGLFARRGQTLEAELRKMFMGESLGFSNANKDTKTRVEALTYRAGLIVGVQPLRAKVLLAGADGGTPQRFVWLPTRDPDMPEDRPAAVGPRVIPPIPFPDPAGDALIDLKVCDVAREAIDRHQVGYHRGAGVDPLDGHALLTGLKVACGLMVLAGRDEVTEEDWEIAGSLMQASRVTRAGIQRDADEQRRQQRLARAADAVAHDEYVSDGKLNRVKRSLAGYLAKLSPGEVITKSDLYGKLRGDLRRDYFGPAMSELIDEGAAFKVPTQRGEGYTASTPSTLVQPTRPADSKGGRGWTPSTPTPPDAETRPGETSNLHRPTGFTPPINGMDPTHANSNPPANELQPPTRVERHVQPDLPPDAPTPETPGYTDNVKRVLASARPNTPTPGNCSVCDEPLWAAASIDRGLCERCHLAATPDIAERTDPEPAT
ncbi:hypothetical protein [Mycobacterium sp. 1423905.2]|uniref:hypothetical protein n=1 Tax=Mycobacterium sp. 1423905.2 TaxID=1856859 RepID=UPI000B2B7058|nr:hypothetical protein [Mycobacterium sp. 1423905.2]